MVGGVGGGVDTIPSRRRGSWCEEKKGSASPFSNVVTWGAVVQSREVTAETDTERWEPGIVVLQET